MKKYRLDYHIFALVSDAVFLVMVWEILLAEEP